MVHGVLVHEEGDEGFVGEDGFFELGALVLDEAAEGGALAGEFVGELAFEAAFVLNEEFAATFIGEETADGAVAGWVVGGAALEVFGLEHAVGEEVDGEGVADGCAEGFEEVEGEGGTAVFGGVVEAECGVESTGPEGGFDFGGEDGVGIAEDGVDGVVRGATGTVFEGELGWEEVVEGVVVEGGGGAFDAAEHFGIGE